MKTRNYHNSRPRFGVFSCWFRGNYHFELLSGIEYEAKLNHVQLFYFAGRTLLSPHPYENNYNVVYDAALDASLDGLVIMSMLNNYNIDKEMNEFLSRYSHIPLVTINFKTTHGNAIYTDSTHGFRELLKHLIEDHGYRKLAFINGPDRNFDANMRLNIYRSVLKSYGISFDKSLISSGYFDYFSGKEAIHTFIDKRKLKPGTDIEVIVCASDEMAWGAMNGLNARGIRIPQDVALTGFDDIRYILFPRSPITTIRQHVFEIGRAAITNLLNYDPKRDDLIFDTELIIRTSCGYHRGNTSHSYGRNSGISEKKTTASDNSNGTVSGNITGIPGDQEDLEFFFYEIISIMNSLKLLKNIREMDEWMVHNLPVLGIESAYLFLYSKSPSPSRFVQLIAGYNRKKQKQGNREKIYPLQTVFDKVLSGNRRQSYCILPLLYKNEQYGLLALEVNVFSSIVFDTISSQIGNSIKNMILIEEVETMNQKLRHANEQKTRFFINIAHETKTPLTLIQNYLERCMKRHTSDPELSIVKQNIDILLENMLNFLDAERLAKGTMSFSHNSFINLSESVRKKCALFRPVAAKKNITIRLHAKDDVVIKINPWALDRILNNLLDNAVKYTQAGGNVSVKVNKTAGKAILCVSDNGPGLPADTIIHLFEPYYQLSKKRSSKQGIGVGLSIVKKIIDNLGASITVANNKSGGANFTCVFTASENLVSTKNLNNIHITESFPTESFPTESFPTESFPAGPSAGIVFQEDITEEDISDDKASILIVDDNVQMLNFLKVSLKKTYNVFLATDAPSAFGKLKTMKRPELIISDIMMDGLDGHMLLATITEMEEYCDIPFIFLTAVSEKNEEIRGLSGGAIDYIKKPFSITELEKKIQSIITLRKRMKKREIRNIRKGIDGLFSKIEGKENLTTPSPFKSLFESLCIKYGISTREKEIIKLLIEGLINKEIAYRLHISKRAVEYHITNIFKKAGVSKRSELLTIFRI